MDKTHFGEESLYPLSVCLRCLSQNKEYILICSKKTELQNSSDNLILEKNRYVTL